MRGCVGCRGAAGGARLYEFGTWGGGRCGLGGVLSPHQEWSFVGGGAISVPPPPFPRSGAVLLCPNPALGGSGPVGFDVGLGSRGCEPCAIPQGWGGGGSGCSVPPPHRGAGPQQSPSHMGRPSSPHGLGLLCTYGAAAAVSPGCGVGGGVSTHPCAPHCDPQPPPAPRAKTPLSCRSSSPPACSLNLTSTAHPVPVSINPQQWGGWGGRGGGWFVGVKTP